MYEHILVPTDGSEAAEQAIEHAVGLAQNYGASIHAVYVVDTTAYAALETGTEMVADALEREGQAAVAEVEEAAETAGVEVSTEIRTGSVAREILDCTEEQDADLVVMGTHGRRGVDRFLLGSVTERIVRRSPVPVLTVRLPAEA